MRIRTIVSAKHADAFAIVFLLLSVSLIILPLPNPVSLDDGLRHLAMARHMTETGFASDTGWGDFFFEGYFAEHNLDPWYLADIAYVPFTLFPMVLGLKLFTLAGILLLAAAFLVLLRSFHLPAAWMAALLLLLVGGDPVFFGRLLIGRPFVLMTVLALLVLHCILSRRAALAGALIGIAVLSSQLFVFPLLVAASGSVWLLFLRKRGAALRMAAFSAIGAGAGLFLHPHTGDYIRYLRDVFLRLPFLQHIGRGGEMYSGLAYSQSVIVVIGFLALLAAALSAAAKERVSPRALHVRGITLTLALSVLFGTAYLFWIRAIDVLWPFLLLLVAQVAGLPGVRAFFAGPLSVGRKTWERSFVFLGGIVLIVLVNMSMVGAQLAATDGARSLAQFQPLAQIPAGARVLNADWDRIPPYLTVRPDITYATGIDNGFTYLTHSGAYRLLEASRGDAFAFEEPIVDAGAWLDQMLRAYPADYLVLMRERYAHFLPALRKVERLKEISGEGDEVSVFEIEGR